jgi:hypothetical protein
MPGAGDTTTIRVLRAVVLVLEMCNLMHLNLFERDVLIKIVEPEQEI